MKIYRLFSNTYILLVLCSSRKILIRFWLKTATETDTDDSDVKPNLSVFEHFGFEVETVNC